MTFEQIIGDLKKKIYHPVYFLHGDEAYYIDQLSDHIEKNVLTDSEKEFNQTILYGKEIDMVTLISYARRYPMMSNYQVIIVKEAQEMKTLLKKVNDETAKKSTKDERNPLIEYLQKPTKTTILVFCYKYERLDKRKKEYKSIEKHSILFESAKLYDDKVPGWITKHVQNNGLKINPKAVVMLAENLGNDLTKITNEVTKLSLNLKPGEEISEVMVIENIGVSKDFNIFELLNAIGNKNVFKAFRIAEYFNDNPKSNPMILTITQLYTYFMKVLTYHQLQPDDRARNNAASILGVNPYFLNDYVKAAKEYSASHCIRIIGHIHEYDLRSKGINNISTSDGELLKELLVKIFN